MDYLDFEISIGPGEGRVYPVHVVRSPAGETRSTMTFPFDELALKSHIQSLQIALLKSASTRRDMSMPEEQISVKEFGQTLFEAVLPGEVRSSYRLSREKARASGKGLRLRLRIEAPDLAALPWEFLYDENEGDFLCLSNETPIVRYLELDRPPEPVAITPPLRVLGMIAAPEDRAQLNVARERQRMSEAIAGLEARGRVTLTWLEGQTWQDLQRAMRQGPWHVFHFVGHGGFDTQSGEGMLALAKEDGRTHRLPATKLGQLLADHRPLRLAVLNACQGAQASTDDIFSSTASVLIRRGIPAVVAMQYEITDRAAIEFSRGFYESLAEGLPVDAAVGEARKAVNFSMAYTVEWGTPVLHMRAPDGRLFDIDAAPAPETTAAEPAGSLVAEPVVDIAAEPEAAPAREPAAPAAVQATAPAHRGASAAVAAPAPTSRASGPPRNVLIGAGVGIALLVLAMAVYWIGEEAAPPIGRVVLVPGAETIDVGATTRIDVALWDADGFELEAADEVPDVLRWTAEPAGLVTIAPDPEGLGATVRGEAPGTVSITATTNPDDAASVLDPPTDTKRLTVLADEPPSPELSEVLPRYLAAENQFDDPTVPDDEVAAAYAALSDADRATLGDANVVSPAAIADLTASLEGLAAAFVTTQNTVAGDTLTLRQQRTQWATFLARADSVRSSSPAVAQATAAIDSLRAIEATSPSLASLTTCRTGGLDCPTSAQTSTFETGQSVYFSAKMNLPSAQRIRWVWLGPNGNVLDEGSDSFPAAPSYRTYQQLRETDAPGRYELRIFSEDDHLIGRRTFTVQPAG